MSFTRTKSNPIINVIPLMQIQKLKVTKAPFTSPLTLKMCLRELLTTPIYQKPFSKLISLITTKLGYSSPIVLLTVITQSGIRCLSDLHGLLKPDYLRSASLSQTSMNRLTLLSAISTAASKSCQTPIASL